MEQIRRGGAAHVWPHFMHQVTSGLGLPVAITHAGDGGGRYLLPKG
jgi:hypothetical protein